MIDAAETTLDADTVALDAGVDDVASDDTPSVLDASTRQKLAALRASKGKPAPEGDELETIDSTPDAESTGADTPAAGAGEAQQGEAAAPSEVEVAWKHIDEHTAKLEARAKEVFAAEDELTKFRQYREGFAEDPVKTFRAFVADMLDVDGAELDKAFIETLTELNIEAGGELTPIERRYESLKKRAEREKAVRERRAKLSEGKQAEAAAKAEEEAQRAKALEVIRGGVDLDRFAHLDLVDGWDAELYARANREYQRTGRVPSIPALAEAYDKELAARYAAKLQRFKPAQTSTPPAAKASTQKAATSKPAPRAEAKVANQADGQEAWSDGAHIAETLAKFRRGFAR